MNAGSDRQDAITQAWVNAKGDGQPRYLTMHNGLYWIDREPALQAPGGYIKVMLDGTYTEVGWRSQKSGGDQHGHAVGAENN